MGGLIEPEGYRIYPVSYNSLMTNMKLKSILLLILSAFMLVLVACGNTQPLPDTEVVKETPKGKNCTLSGGEVVEDGWSRQEIVQSQGDHLLIQGQWGGKYGEIRHNPEAGEYSLTRPSLFSNWEYNVSYSPEQYTRSSNTGASTVSATSNGDGSTTTQLGWLQGGYDSNDTSTGWTTKAHGLLSGTYTYTVDGGR